MNSITDFWSKVNKNGPIHPVLKTRCWEWGGCRSGRRYGVFRFAGRQIYVHRLSWELCSDKKLLLGVQVLHKCDNMICVNPNHLFLGTRLDNRRDCVSKGRQAKGISINTVKLREEEVAEIRKLYRKGSGTVGLKGLAKRFGVSFSTIRWIVKGVTWKHLGVSDA